MEICPICKQENIKMLFLPPEQDACKFSCNNCGDFTITGSAEVIYFDKERDEKLSFALHQRWSEHKETIIDSNNREEILASVLFPNTIKEKIQLILNLLYSNKISELNPFILGRNNYFTFGIEDINELFMVFQYLADNQLCKMEPIGDGSNSLSSNGKTIQYIEEIGMKKKLSNDVFVAMWFDTEMDLSWGKGFLLAIEHLKYKAVRIDKKQHNNDVTDELIKCIDQSKFMIADFTGDRGGVYYEAGYARGIKIPVIYTCRKDWFEEHKPHFDIDHFPFIRWENEDDLKNQLIERIKATIK